MDTLPKELVDYIGDYCGDYKFILKFVSNFVRSSIVFDDFPNVKVIFYSDNWENLLFWIVDNNLCNSKKLYRCAAIAENLPAIEKMHNIGLRWDYTALESAIEAGNLVISKWLFYHHCPTSNYDINSAMLSNNLEMVKWLLDIGVCTHKCKIYLTNNLEVFKYCIQNEINIFVSHIFEYCTLEIFLWCVDGYIVSPAQCLDVMSITKDIFWWLVDNGYDVFDSEFIYDIIIENSDYRALDMFKKMDHFDSNKFEKLTEYQNIKMYEYFKIQ